MKKSPEFVSPAPQATKAGEFNKLGASGRAQLQASTRLLISGLLLAMLCLAGIITAPSAARAGEISIGVSLSVGPPPIPIYTQPPCPAPGYMWTPGYWAFDPANGYYWVPGTWVLVPQPGMYWTPGYWGWGGSAFVWHIGYWGPHVGFYGGINYGFGYTGVGFAGGEWRGGNFFYNRSVANLGGGHFDNVYSRSVPNNFAMNRVSYNGGTGGLNVRPGSAELLADRDKHIPASATQRQTELAAHNDRSQFASFNHGRPGVTATPKAGEYSSGGAKPPAWTGESHTTGANHGPTTEHPTTGFTGYHSPNSPGGTHKTETHETETHPTYNPGTHPTGGPTHTAPTGGPGKGSSIPPGHTTTHNPPPSSGHGEHEPDKHH